MVILVIVSLLGGGGLIDEKFLSFRNGEFQSLASSPFFHNLERPTSLPLKETILSSYPLETICGKLGPGVCRIDL
jgi:hypothetical protein